jgi:hypothetical protein
MPWASGDIIVAVLEFNVTTKLVTSNDAGANWSDRGGLSDFYNIVMRDGDTTFNQLFIADGANGPKYSADRGANVVSKTGPGGNALWVDVYG